MPLWKEERSPVEFLDRLYQRQSEWTRPLRNFFFHQRFSVPFRVLDAGSGTGVLGNEIAQKYHAEVYSIDLNRDVLAYSRRQRPDISFHAQADIYHLPFPPRFFHCAITHFVFLWLKHPQNALKELIRVTMPGGWIVAFAEPDYEARIDYPGETAKLGQIQKQSLIKRGINPTMGRELFALFNECGLRHVTSGLYSGEWKFPLTHSQFVNEWETLENDLWGYLSFEEIQSYREQDFQNFVKGKRLSFVPTFYAYGQVQG